MEKKIDSREIWSKYQECLDYINSKALRDRTNKNWNFYKGKQWEGISLGANMPKDDLPMLNFIKPVIKYKVSTVAQKKMVARYTDMSYNPDMKDTRDKLCAELSRYFAVSWEKAQMDKIVWDILKACAIQGDAYTYFGSGDPKNTPKIIPNTSILLGDENTPFIQDQPYIIIRERLNVDVVKQKAKENGLPKSKIDMIKPDSDNTDEIQNIDEVTDKVTSLVYMEKKDGYLCVARTTRTVCYEEYHQIRSKKNDEYTDIGATLYPIASVVWEKTPNDARGISEVEQQIPNQLELNKTLVRRSLAIKSTAFPKLAYDSNAIDNADDLDKVGGKIKLQGLDARSVNQMVSYISAAPMTSDPKLFCDELLNTTRELAGAGDLATGNINPERTSGTAITMIRDQAQLPLNEQVQMSQQYVEDIARIWLDMLIAYQPEEIVLDNIIIEPSALKELAPDIRVDISDESAWSKYLEQQNLDSLLERQYITFDEYVKIMPENANFPKDNVLKVLGERTAQNGTEEIGTEEIGTESIEQQGQL